MPCLSKTVEAQGIFSFTEGPWCDSVFVKDFANFFKPSYLSAKEECAMHKKLRREAAYLAGKPMRIRWWVLLLYMILPIAIAGFVFGDFIIHGTMPLERLMGWEIFFGIGLFCLPTLFITMRMSQMIIIKDNGLFFRDSFRREHVIPYASIIAYTNSSDGIAVETYDKRYFFRVELSGHIYLCNEIKRRVGEDREVKEKV